MRCTMAARHPCDRGTTKSARIQSPVPHSCSAIRHKSLVSRIRRQTHGSIPSHASRSNDADPSLKLFPATEPLILYPNDVMSPLAAPLCAVLALLGVSSLTWGRSSLGGLFSFVDVCPSCLGRTTAFGQPSFPRGARARTDQLRARSSYGSPI